MSDRTHLLAEEGRLTQTAADLYETLRGFFLRRLRSSESADADDLVQEVFVHLAHRTTGEVRSDRSDAYVFVTAANLLRDRSRRRAARRADQHLQFDEDLHAGREDLDPERVLIGKQSIEQMREGLLTLPPRTRAVFLLYRFEHLKRGEIAARLGISQSLVEKELAKAFRTLTNAMERSQ